MTAINASRLAPLCWIFSGFAFLWTFSVFAQQPSNEAAELPLDDAVQIALNHNRPVQIAKLDVTKSQWQVAETKTKRLPAFSTDLLGTVDLTSPVFLFKEGVFGTYNNQPIPSQDTKINLSNGVTGYAIASVAQPLTQLYQLHLAIREQELATDLAGQKYQEKRQSLVADVKQAYYAVLQTESSLDAQQALVKEYQETDRVAAQYLTQKSILKSESLDVKLQLAQAQNQMVTSEDDLEIQKEHLNDLLARDLDTPFRTQPVPAARSEEMDLKQAREKALRQRPEVKEAQINVDQAGYDRRLAKSQYYPAIGGSVRYFTPINTQLLPQNILSAGLEMTWDPFEWGARKDVVEQKDVVVQQSKYQLDQTRSQVMLDVDNTFRKLRESRSLLLIAQAQRDAASEKLREVNNQFGQSAVLLRDVLKQESAVANANHDYEASLLSFWNAKAAFEKALGEE
jgi:outer membrane protein TolC